MSQSSGRNRRAIGARLVRSAFNRSQRIAAMLALFSMLWYSAVPAGAGTNYWQQSGAGVPDAVWDNVNNWSLGAVAGATDDVIFPTPIPFTGNTIFLNPGDLANSLTFRDSYSLTGGDLTLGAIGNVTVASGSTATINSQVIGSGGITLAGTNGLLGLDAQAGGGTLALNGFNTYTGATTISSGVLSTSFLSDGGSVSNIGASTNDAANLVINGGTLLYTGGFASSDRLFTVGANGATIDASGTAPLTFTNVGSLAYGGAGARTLTLTGSNTAANTLSANIADNGADPVSLNKTGSGLWTLAGFSNTYSGGTTLSGGTLSISDLNNIGGATKAITFNGGTLQVTGFGITTLDTNVVNWGSFNGGIDVATPGSTLTSTQTLNVAPGGLFTKTGVGTMTLAGAGSNTGPIFVALGTLNLSKTGGADAVGTAGIAADTTGFPTGTGQATISLQASDQINDLATVTLNSATSGNAAQFLLNGFNEKIGGLNMTGTTTAGDFVLTGAGTLTVNGDIVLNANRNATGNTGREVLISGSGTYGSNYTSGGTLDLGGASRNIIVNTNNTQTNSDATIETVIQNGGIVKSGTGRLRLAGNNTFSGGLTVTQGTVAVMTGDANLGSANNVITLDGGGISSGFNTLGSLASYTPPATRIFNIGAGGGTFDVVSTTGNPSGGKILLTFPQLVGSSNVSKTGNGDLQITVAQTGYTGTWTINGGVVEAQNNGSLGAGNISINTGGELVVTGPATLANAITMNGGTLSANGTGGPISTGPINVAANSTLAARTFQATGTRTAFTVAGPISGSANLNISGTTGGASGVVSITNNNTGFSGNFNVLANAQLQPTVTSTVNALGSGAVNLSGGSLNLSSSATAAGANAGFVGRYYASPSITNGVIGGFDFANNPLFVSRTDATVNFTDLTQAAQRPPLLNSNNFGVLWTGTLKITNAGTYNFSTASDDGSQMYIDGVPLVQNDASQGVTKKTGELALGAGFHSVIVRYGEGGGGTSNVVTYQGITAGADGGGNEIVMGSIANSVTNNGTALFPDATPITNAINLTGGTNSTINLGGSNGTLSGPVTFGGNAGLTVAGTIGTETLTLSGPVALNGNNSLNVGYNSIVQFMGGGGNVVVTGDISELSGGSSLTKSGSGTLTLSGNNSFTGTVTATGGLLNLNAAPGATAISGSLAVAASTTDLNHPNVKLLGSDQIADSSSVTVSGGVLDINSRNDTINALTMTGGAITGTTGTLTVSNLGFSAFSGGSVLANMAGSGPVSVNFGSVVTFAGNNTYVGDTTVQSGAILRVGGGTSALGAAGNNLNVVFGGQVQFAGNSSVTGIDAFTSGDGISSDGVFRNISGRNSFVGTLNLTSDSVIQADMGSLRIGAVKGSNSILTTKGTGDIELDGAQGIVSIIKNNSGALIFGSNQSVFPTDPLAPISLTVNAGYLGFNGPQSFGAVTLSGPVQFNSDPGSGVSITTNTPTRVIGGYNFGQELISRITAGSTGAVTLTADSSTDLNFSANPNLYLGAESGIKYYRGNINPGVNGYNLGGGNGTLVPTQSMDGGGLNIGGNVNLTQMRNTNSGPIVLNSGTLSVLSDFELGNAANSITVNGGTLRVMTANFGNQNGTIITPIARNINFAGNGTIDVPQGANVAMLTTTAQTMTGAGKLTKTGFGSLFIGNTMANTGNVVIADQGGVLDMRGAATLLNSSGITIGQNGFLNVDNNSTLSGILTSNTATSNRVGDSIPISLQGGRLMYVGRNTALVAANHTSDEVFGTVTVGLAQSEIRAERTGGGGSDLIISNLVRNYGSGTVVFTAGSTLAQFNDNGRTILNTINTGSGAVAPTAGQFIGGWALTDQGTYNFVVEAANATVGGVTATNTGITYYGNANSGLAYTTLTSAATPGTGGFTSGAVGNINNIDVTLGTAGTPANFTLQALRIGGNATRQVLFANSNDTLYVESGGILRSNDNNASNIGTAASRGILTAGSLTSGLLNTPQELFLHNNQNTMTVFSNIVDNPTNSGATVKLVKDLGGTVVIDSSFNTYSGGTAVLRGALSVNNTGGLGTGPVYVHNASLTLANIGATSSTAGYTVESTGEIFLSNNSNNGASSYTTQGDRFTISAGSTISANILNAGFGINSLTRVSGTPANGGEIYLAPDSIVRHNNIPNAPNQGTGSFTINNLGTNADLYYSPAGGTGALTTLTIGTNTPWKGLSSSTASGNWNSGTIIANSDFYLQGLQRDGGIQILNFGSTSNVAPYAIVNNSDHPINAYLTGNMGMNADVSPSFASDLTFVIGAGATIQPNRSNSFGTGANVAKVLVQAGGTVDPGNYVGVGAAVGQPNNVPYPVPGPLNMSRMELEAGGRLLLNDVSGLGTAPVGSIVFDKDSILELSSNQSSLFLGNAAGGLINPGQFVFSPGAVVRLNNDNIFKISQFVDGEPNGSRLIYEVFQANRTLTNQTDIRFDAVTNPNSNKLAPENITLGNGGMLTNDSNSRQANGGFGGTLIINTGAIFAASNGTTFTVQDDFDLAAGATLRIGSSDFVEGNQKLGPVVLTGTNSQANSRAGANAQIQVQNGAQLIIANNNVNGISNFVPDNLKINLPSVVTTPALQPTVGSSLRLSNGNSIETIGSLTGPGIVVADQANAVLQIGGDNLDSTFAGVFSSAGSQQPNLAKAGTGILHLTGANTSTGTMTVNRGTIALDGAAGQVAFATDLLGKGGTLLIDNSTNALANRLGNKSVTGLGGTLRLKGGATAANETFLQLNTGGGAGGTSFINLEPGTAQSNLTATTFQNFNNSNATSVFVLRGASLGQTSAAPATNGRFIATNPDLTYQAVTNYNYTAGVFNVSGAIGSPIMGMRPDALGDTSLTGTGQGFVTQDSTTTGFRLLADSEYLNAALPSNGQYNSNILASGTTSFFGNTTIQSLTLNPGATLNGTGLIPYSQNVNRLSIVSSGILARAGGTSTINVNFLDRPTNQGFYFHTLGDAVLNINAAIFANQGFIKDGTGTLNLGTGAVNNVFGSGTDGVGGNITISDGTVNLAAGNVFPISAPTSGGPFVGVNFNINGGTFNLGGNSQTINTLVSNNPLPGNGGTITSTTPATLTVHGGGVFSGNISGAISLNKTNANNLVLTSANDYTGTTFVRGNTLSLRDDGRLTNSQQFEINYGTLLLDSGNLISRSDRLNSASVVNMRGGTFQLNGSAFGTETQTIATMNLMQGGNIINVNPGGSGTAEITIGNLTRSPGAIAFFQTQTGNLGAPGTGDSNSRIFLNKINGNAFTQANLTNGIIGGWAVVNGADFASYIDGQGVVAMGNIGAGALNYSTNALTAAAATDNITIGGNPSASLNNTTVNSLRVTGAATVTMVAGQTLTINSGGLLTNTNNGVNFNAGSLTSGGSELFVTVSQNTTTINSVITNNAGGAVTLIKTGGSTLALTGNNTYTGGTIVSNGTLNLSTAGGNGTTTVSIPGDVTINGSANLNTTVTGQIKNTANVTMNGSAVFTIGTGFAETVNSVTFNGIGGITGTNTSNSGIVLGSGTLNITGANAVTSINDNASSIPTFSGSLASVNFAGPDGTAQTINVSGSVQYGLLINGNINDVPAGVVGGGLVKTGPGMLALGGGASTFGGATNGIHVQEGILRVDNNGALGAATNVTTVDSGASIILGGQGGTANLVGSIVLNGGTMGVTLTSPGLGAAVANPPTTLTLANGTDSTVNLYDFMLTGAIGRTLTVNSKVTGSGNLTINGPADTGVTGTFRLANQTTGGNDMSGTITVNNNAILLAQSGAAGVTTGNELGTATVNLNGGTLQLRDDNSVTYNNTLRVSANSFLSLDRTSAGVNPIFTIPTLDVAAGTSALTVSNGNGATMMANNLTGSGTLLKAGAANLTINNIDSGFTGGLGVAGAVGVNTQPTFSNNSNLILGAAVTAVPNLNVAGLFHVPGGKVLNVTNTLSVAGSYVVGNGTNNVTVGANTGALLIPNTATFNAATIQNDGIIGTSGGPVTLSPAGVFAGKGQYLTTGQPITLNGVLGDGAGATTLNVVGNNTVNLTPVASGTNTGGAIVQSGTLRVAPAVGSLVNPLGTGPIKVYGVPATALGTNSQPVSAVTAVLQFDQGFGSTVTQAGNITNSGLVHAKSGNTSVAGVIAGPGNNAYVPGLLEGLIGTGTLDASLTRPANPGNFGIKVEPRMAQTNVVTQNAVTGWGDNQTWVYTGQFHDADGKFTFAENIDDNVMISIDGVARLLSNTGTNPYQTVTATSSAFGQRGTTIDTQTGTAPALVSGNTAGNVGGAPALDMGMGPNNDGWHTIEIRVTNGAGGAGPAVGNGFNNNYGLGLNTDGTTALDGSAYTRPIDPGDGSLFRTQLNAAGDIQVDPLAILTVGGTTQINNVNLNTDGFNGGTLVYSDKAGPAASNSDFANLNVAGAGGVITLGTNNVVNVSTVNIAANFGGKLTVNSTGTAGTSGVLNVGTPIIPAGTTLQVDSAVVNVSGTGTGQGDVVVNGGLLHVLGTSAGINTGAITVNGGTARVTGSVATSTGVTVNNTGTFEANSTQTVKNLTVNDGAVARITTGVLKILTVGDNTSGAPLTITSAGKVDLNSNAMVVDYSAGNEAAAAASVRSQIIAGYNPTTPTSGNGDWQGNGITSSDAIANRIHHSVGYAQASDVLRISGAQTGIFLGQTVDASSILVRGTLNGDSNLDGTVSFADLVAVAQHYGTSNGSATWFTGDFNYDGNVSFADLVAVAQNYGGVLPSSAIPGASASFENDLAAAFSSSVPEPTSLGVIALAGLALLRRRRR